MRTWVLVKNKTLVEPTITVNHQIVSLQEIRDQAEPLAQQTPLSKPERAARDMAMTVLALLDRLESR